MLNKTLARKALPWALLALGCALVAWGVARAEPGIILKKAVRVCLECIGIG